MTRYRFILMMVMIGTMLGGGMVQEAKASHQDTNEEPTCKCSTSMRFSRPELQFANGVLTFIPRVDLNFSSRGSSNAPSWTAVISHSGSTSYTSEDVSVPDGVSFSGEKTVVTGMCGSRYSLKGYQLGSVPLNGLTPTLVGEDQEVTGQVKMQATVTGCEEETIEKSFSFRLQELGNILIRSWRTVR